MFKKIVYSVILGGLTAGFAACSADPDYKDGSQLMGEAYTFFQSTLNSTMLPGNAEFTVDLIRTTTSGTATLPLTLAATDGKTIDGMTVTDAVFADGSNKATVTISITNGMPPAVYGGTLSMAADKVSATGYQTMYINIPVEYEWEEMEGLGWYQDVFIGMPWQEIKFMKAVGFDRWRAMDPYLDFIKSSPSLWCGYDPTLSCHYVEFYDLGNGKLSFDEFVPGFTYDGTGIFHCVPGTFVGKIGQKDFNLPGWGLNGDNNFWVEPLYVHLAPSYIGTEGDGWWNYADYSDNGVFLTLPGY